MKRAGPTISLAATLLLPFPQRPAVTPVLIDIVLGYDGNTVEASQRLRSGLHRTAHGEMTSGEAPCRRANTKARKMGTFAIAGYPESISFTIEYTPRPNDLQVSSGVDYL